MNSKPTIFFLTIMAAAIISLAGTTTISHAAETSGNLSLLAMKSKKNSNKKPYFKVQERDTLIGNTYRLYLYNVEKDDNVSFESSDSDILAVKKTSQNTCDYRGISTGHAKIIIKIRSQGFLFIPKTKTLTCNINVSPKAASITFQKSVYRMSPGETRKMKLTKRPSISKEKAVFESSNPSIATINSNGRVTALSTGRVYITARIENGTYARCKIIIKNKQES